jgi:hypothetical protein
MEFIKLRLDPETSKHLVTAATQELRPIHLQAEVILMRALGTWGNLPAAPDPQLYDHLATAAPTMEADLAFHPRAAKLMRKRKNFVVVAEDEPYFIAVYDLIREHELARGNWDEADETLYRAAIAAAKGS